MQSINRNEIIVQLGPKDNMSWIPEICYFAGHRDEPKYELNMTWYHIIMAKLVFVLVYEVTLVL